jgi:hypothetical protein
VSNYLDSSAFLPDDQISIPLRKRSCSLSSDTMVDRVEAGRAEQLEMACLFCEKTGLSYVSQLPDKNAQEDNMVLGVCKTMSKDERECTTAKDQSQSSWRSMHHCQVVILFSCCYNPNYECFTQTFYCANERTAYEVRTPFFKCPLISFVRFQKIPQ